MGLFYLYIIIVHCKYGDNYRKLIDSIKYVLKIFLKKNHVDIDIEEFILHVETHHTFPGLFAITSAFDFFNIDNVALDLPREDKSLNELPDVFIAIVNRGGHQEELVYVRKVSDELFHVENKAFLEKVSANEFLKIWTGVVLAIDERIPKNKWIPWSYNGILLFLAISSFILFLSNWEVFHLFYFSMSFIGVMLSYLLFLQKNGREYELVKKICKGLSGKFNCQDVTSSSGASIFGIDFTHMGIVYFSTSCLSQILLLYGGMTSYALIYFLTLISVPFIVYSTYYQYRVIKTWCPLCLGVLSVLVVQLVCLSFFKLDFFTSIVSKSSLVVLFSYILVSLVWYHLFPVLILKNNFQDLRVRYYMLKNNFHVFNFLARSQIGIKSDLENSSEIVLGNLSTSTPIRIIYISNPTCIHCRKSMMQLLRLLERHENIVQVRFRFNVNTTSFNNQDFQIASLLIAIYHFQGAEVLFSALKEVYVSSFDFKVWREKWKLLSGNAYNREVMDETLWCADNGIYYTPETILNSRILPKIYSNEDIERFVEELSEEYDQEFIYEQQLE